MQRIITAFLFVFVLGFGTPALAKNWYDTGNLKSEVLFDLGSYTISHINFNGTSIIRVWGEIDVSTLSYLNLAWTSIGPQYLSLAGPGGNFASSLAIGNYIHENNISVVILPLDACLSACAYAAIASPNLDMHGMLGFHMPYMAIDEKNVFSDGPESIKMDKGRYFVLQHIINATTWDTIKWLKHYTQMNDEHIDYIIINSNAASFVALTSSEDLDSLKSEEPAEFIFSIMDENDVNEWYYEKLRTINSISDKFSR